MRVAAVGDLMLGDSAICVGFGFASSVAEQPLHHLLEGIRPIFRRSDIVIGNLETPIAPRASSRMTLENGQMRGRPRFARELAEAGFTVINVANNHAMQHGLAAFEESVRLLRSAGLAVCGLRSRRGWHSDPVKLSIRGRQIGVLGYSLRPRQYCTGPPAYADGSPERMLEDVDRLRSDTDAVLVSVHWGEEFVDRPSEAEAELGRRLVDAGAAAVIGHHPHVLRPIESYREGVIAYSLGNLIGDMIWQEPLRQGGVLELEVGHGTASVSRFTPTRVNDEFRPVVDTDATPVDAEAAEPLDAGRYALEVRRSLSAQRIAAYRYALRNLHRYPGPILVQLAHQTLWNKLRGAWPWKGRER